MAPAADGVGVGSVPPLLARDLDGKRFDLEEALEDGPVVITFWATWCKPCRKEMPELQKLLVMFRNEDEKDAFRVIAVNGDGPADQAKVRPYVKSQKFDFTVIPDQDGEVRRNFQVEVFPTTFLVDRDGNVLHRTVGYRRGDEKILAERLEALLGESSSEKPDTEPGADTEDKTDDEAGADTDTDPGDK